ncbi:tubulin/FtsZ family GTPase domain protein [Theileria parva strain Muguga]|uniref:Tubulin/FtsZ GTPase domain-containing protein n=1 Tax=Theileria parva TaxID=5875 RepID=Q4N7F3_THEPA|nr:tubulin/FtsZ family GTPase domain protein [Theileria parva strain Muguga]EAN34105.1 tubulin/FtsZ family GTPase domain protein [Theileria parva strain Muguga]|eukprot:XP_766388.1 hypothetical protein [Theileria parva strain Muguga]
MELLWLNFGQCGLQIADTYWTNLANNFTKNFSENGSHTSFYTTGKDVGIDVKKPKLSSLKPRCLVIDTETITSDEILINSKHSLLTKDNVLTDNGSHGGNFMTVFNNLGQKYWKSIQRYVFNMMEKCDHFEYFNLTLGVGGSSGSALGAYTAQMLSQLYPKIPIITNIVDDENTSPVASYNTLFSLSVLQEHSTMIIPFSNNNIIESIKKTTDITFKSGSKDYFNPINSVISNFLQEFNNVTVFPDSRFNRIDIIKNSLLPFQNMNYTCPLKSPVVEPRPNCKYHLDQLYEDLFIGDTRISPIPTHSDMLPITISILNGGNYRNLKYSITHKMRNGTFTWNKEEPKSSTHDIGEDFKPITTRHPLVALSNHTGISHYLDKVCDNVESLVHRNAFLHQFEGMIDNEEIYYKMMKLRETSQMCKQQDAMIKKQFRDVDLKHERTSP